MPISLPSNTALAEKAPVSEPSYQEVQLALQRDPLFDEVFNEVYNSLRRVAASLRRNFRDVTLTPTEVVNEASLKMMRAPSLAWKDQLHFKRIAALAMKQILRDAVRRKLSVKRGADPIRVTLSEWPSVSVAWDESILDLNRLLDELGEMDARAAQAVDLRFFGGCTVPETAAALGVSVGTAETDLRFAIAWLQSKLGVNVLQTTAKAAK